MKNWLANMIGKGILADYVDSPLSEVPFLALDFEFNSLNKKQVKFMSAGWVTGQQFQIHYEHSYYRLIRAKGDLQQSPIIHGLTARDIAQGVHAKEMYSALMEYAPTHVWILHNAFLDMNMLKELAYRFGEAMPAVTTIDTMQLALHKLGKGSGQYGVKHDAATLDSCRRRFDLPSSPLHNALSDAQATLELFYAQLYDMDPKAKMRLKDLKAMTSAVKVY
jgi:DNA polymerase-3 subunit epsilon